MANTEITLPCAVRWMEFNRKGELVTKEKEFKTAAAREKFLDTIDSRPNYHSLVAISS